jgi:hypothetical protein
VGFAADTAGGDVERSESLPPLGGTQVLLLGASVALISCYRGYEVVFAQGQLMLTMANTRLQSVVWGLGFLGMALLAPSTKQNKALYPHMGLTPLAIAPLILALWSLLPMVTHITTALLVLELVGAALL